MSAEHLEASLQDYDFKKRVHRMLSRFPRVFSYRVFKIFLEGLREAYPK